MINHNQLPTTGCHCLTDAGVAVGCQTALPGVRQAVPHPRRGFTIMELLIVILIIGLLAGISWAALLGAVEQARESRTRSIVNKLDQLVGAKWESYRTRRLPMRTTGIRPKSELFTDANSNGFWDSGESFVDAPPYNASYDRGATYFRLMAIRELQRMELPDRRTDIVDLSAGAGNPHPMEVTATGMAPAALQRTYYLKAVASTGGNPQVPATTVSLDNWTAQHEGAECLFLIVSAMNDGDKNAIDFFSADEIGDVDGDGMREIHDGWGNPIEFLRWAPSYTRESAVGDLATQTSFVDTNTGEPIAPDNFDPVDEDARDTYALRPLIFSAGRDGSYDVNVEGGLRYVSTIHPNDPYYLSSSNTQAGLVGDIDGDGSAIGWVDNITNHYQEPQ